MESFRMHTPFSFHTQSMCGRGSKMTHEDFSWAKPESGKLVLLIVCWREIVTWPHLTTRGSGKQKNRLRNYSIYCTANLYKEKNSYILLMCITYNTAFLYAAKSDQALVINLDSYSADIAEYSPNWNHQSVSHILEYTNPLKCES